MKIYILEKVLNEFLHKNERLAKREMGHIRVYIYIYIYIYTLIMIINLMYTIKVLEAFHNPFKNFSRILEI